MATITVAGTGAAAFARLAEQAFDTVSAFEAEDGVTWGIDLYFEGAPDRGDLDARLAVLAAAAGCAAPAATVVAVPPVDWVAATRVAFPPIEAGRFLIHGGHLAPPRSGGRLALAIDATTAFGTGEHPTTRLMLDEIDRLGRLGRLGRRPARVLDLGCGSGILGIAAVKRLHPSRPVVAGDIDAGSIRVAAAHARMNGVHAGIRLVTAAGLRHPLIRRRGPYDLILANILARPLIDLAGDIVAALAPGGRLVLAGLMAPQAAAVLAAYRARGLTLARWRDRGVWCALCLRRRPGSAGTPSGRPGTTTRAGPGEPARP